MWAYAEKFVPEDDVLARARGRAAELGCPAVSAGTGGVLRLMAATVAARSTVEIGTGAGRQRRLPAAGDAGWTAS